MSKEKKSKNSIMRGGETVKIVSSAGPPEMDWNYFKPLEVKVQYSAEGAIKYFRNLVQKDGILVQYKQKSRYEKPSDRLRREKDESIRRLKELEIKKQKIASGEYEKERIRKEKKKELKKKMKEEALKKAQETESNYSVR